MKILCLSIIHRCLMLSMGVVIVDSTPIMDAAIVMDIHLVSERESILFKYLHCPFGQHGLHWVLNILHILILLPSLFFDMISCIYSLL